MGHHWLAGNPPVAVALRHSAQARRMTLRISSLDGRVTLTVPRGVSEAEALAFAESRGDWLRQHLANTPDEVIVGEGATLPLEGALHRVVLGPGRSVTAAEGQITVPARSRAIGRAVEAFLKTRARDRLAAASDHYAHQLGRAYSALALRDTRSRWGSCTSAGRLMYNWRLVLAPPDILRYVAAHEVAHLAEMNHSPAFWAHVTALYGSHDAARRWLKTNGAALHRFRFEG